MTRGLVHASYSLPEWQAVKLTFFAPWTYAYINILLSFRDCLAFATEPIFASLANILGKHDNMPSQISPEFKVDISLFCLVHVVCKE